MAFTVHNFPEGLAIGVAFGAAAAGFPAATLSAAVLLTISLAIQNFPEGIAVALPLRREGMSRLRSFWYGQSSALVEPVGGVLGAAAVLLARSILPYALGFAAGAMIYVVVAELIPESRRHHPRQAALSALLGVMLMVFLEMALG